ncbi:acyl-CoA dehydrogenase [Skermanella stibiiresistens SB22]|uniref:Acyl-CoA dehydrogenase n=1 Tax=Skermanella stibiiresistens SB22 TaxID=1385369 RepID=W9GY41_9PROT|nr:acyl-CoA dehydrogenase family protein [Skermanella stibiiresistens]EWY38709.1 acyl-CoA dehydrogenase [Skermanella stibiiresistens SB22]
MQGFRFNPTALPPEAEAARTRVRRFLAGELEAGTYAPHRSSWTTFDAGFSRRAGAAGLIGMTLPTRYGGQEQSDLARFVVTAELLAAGAPCFAHWVADRQSAPQILRHGSERARREILPPIARGECFFGIGMSEPDAGSDLAAVRTRAVRTDGGWLVTGSKIWTSNAHRVHYLIALVRTGDAGENRHGGLTQVIVDLSKPGVTVRPILNMAGHHEFNEVFFSDYLVPDDMVLGAEGQGWEIVTSELAFERSGPDRFLSDYPLLVELIDRVGPTPDARQAVEIGRLIAHLAPLMRMSRSVAGLLHQGQSPEVEAALVKDVGTAFEREVPEVARRLVPVEAEMDSGDDDAADRFADALAHTVLDAPAYTLRGGTREVMRGVIARGLGLR